jgi:hypothetical protein
MRALVKILLFCISVSSVAQGQLKLHDAELVVHAVVFGWDAESGKYTKKETFVEDPKEVKKLDRLMRKEAFSEVFERKDLLIVRFRVEGNPITWVPITDGKVDIIDLEGRNQRISIAELKSLWQAMQGKRRETNKRDGRGNPPGNSGGAKIPPNDHVSISVPPPLGELLTI